MHGSVVYRSKKSWGLTPPHHQPLFDNGCTQTDSRVQIQNEWSTTFTATGFLPHQWRGLESYKLGRRGFASATLSKKLASSVRELPQLCAPVAGASHANRGNLPRASSPAFARRLRRRRRRRRARSSPQEAGTRREDSRPSATGHRTALSPSSAR